jgi:hypothetical protein
MVPWVWLGQPTAHVAGTDADLEYYVREAGDILGVTGELPGAMPLAARHSRARSSGI